MKSGSFHPTKSDSQAFELIELESEDSTLLERAYEVVQAVCEEEIERLRSAIKRGEKNIH